MERGGFATREAAGQELREEFLPRQRASCIQNASKRVR
jgi:hypothetical protein